MKNNYLVPVGVVIALILGLIGTFRHSTVIEQVTRSFGGTSPDIASPYVDFGGVRHWYFTSALNQASTTICSFQSPVATSTLVFASVTWTTGSSTALILDIAKSVSPSASTTLFGSYAISANKRGTIIASTTPQGVTTFGLDPVIVFSAAFSTSTTPTGVATQDYTGKQYLNYVIGGENGVSNVLTGACKAEFIQNI